MARNNAAVTPGADFARVLLRLLEERGMSKRQLAKRLAEQRRIAYDTAKSNVAKWTAGKHLPNRDNRIALAEILEAPQFVARDPAADETLRALALLADRLTEVERRLDERE